MLVKFREHMRESGLKVTGPRLEIFRFLQQRDLTSVSELIAHCRGKVDRATVYRTISLFRELGVIHEVVAAGSRKIELTDRFASHHHHLSCLQCGRSELVCDVALETDLERIAQKCGFRQLGHQIEISGICSSCQEE